MNPCESLPLSTAPYYREARVTFAWRQTACRMRHCCARRIEETGGRRKLLRTSIRSAERQRIIEAEANRIAMPTRQRRAMASAIGKHCSSSSCSLAMGNAFLLDGHTARFLSRERKWGVWSCGAHAAYPSARCAENPSSIFLTKNPQHGMLTTTKGSEKETFSFHPLKRGDGRCKSLRNGKGGAFEPRGGNAAPVPPLQGNEVPRIQRGIQVEPRTMICSP